MESSLGLLLVLIATLANTHIVQAQDQKGFYSLDCGLPVDEPSPYTENSTGLLFSSDESFIQSGKTGRIKENPEGYVKPYETLRYFPEGIRNCYKLSVEKGRNYLIKASFVYGNYDGSNNTPVFDLYLGPNRWAEIDLQGLKGTREEILHVPTSNSLQFCLVKTGTTTPLISTLELRPMGNDSYITKSGSLKHFFRRYFSKSASNLRYSKDVYDRTWVPFFKKEWTQISSGLAVYISNNYYPAEDAVKNAATPTDTSAPLTIEWTSTNSDDQYYYYAHFAEIEDLQANETRELKVLWNGIRYYGPFTPTRSLLTIFSTKPQTSCDGGRCSFQVIRTNRSTLPPLLNALEVYTVIEFPQSETDESDVVAMENIKATYGLSRIDWQGDPCLPQQLRWTALICRDTAMFIPPRITSLNLSSSGLAGTIASAIQDLTQLEILDLSNNNLAGGVPEFLGNMKSLSVINLSGNNLNGSLPQALQRKGLKLSVEGNPRLCLSDSCIKPPTRKFPVAIVASVASLVTAIAVVVLFLVLRKKNSNTLQGPNLPQRNSSMNGTFANKNSRRFTYSEVIQMTNNFRRVLGKGGFGEVYHGYVNDSEEVAVKVISQSSTQGYKEFKAEVFKFF